MYHRLLVSPFFIEMNVTPFIIIPKNEARNLSHGGKAEAIRTPIYFFTIPHARQLFSALNLPMLTSADRHITLQGTNCPFWFWEFAFTMKQTPREQCQHPKTNKLMNSNLIYSPFVYILNFLVGNGRLFFQDK